MSPHEVELLALRAIHPDGYESHDYTLPADKCPSCVANDAKMELERVITPEWIAALCACVRIADAIVWREGRFPDYDAARAKLRRLKDERGGMGTVG